jgi:hypothetical protein
VLFFLDELAREAEGGMRRDDRLQPALLGFPRSRHKLLACLSSFVLPLGAQACEEGSVALRYLGAIQAMDWSAMEALLDPAARYQDPTMAYFDRPPIDLAGSEAIVDFWRSSSEESGSSAIRYTVTDCFETAGYTTISYDILVDVAGSYWNVNQQSISIPGRVVSVLRTTEDSVVLHIDYVDYAGAEAWIDELRDVVGPAVAEP